MILGYWDIRGVMGSPRAGKVEAGGEMLCPSGKCCKAEAGSNQKLPQDLLQRSPCPLSPNHLLWVLACVCVAWVGWVQVTVLREWEVWK